ncbi:protein mono-ADP-ribosyltransferase PARP12 [Heterodontus francisci]|uniref:protein mono-ADP-ribosyltransferase PARP12 n=1 Tax=Heterodontus francisci TaxID=7792 RepID=UPI00355B78B1
MASSAEPVDEEDSYSDDSDYSNDYDDSDEELSGSDLDSLAEGAFDDEQCRKSRAERAGTQPCKYYNKSKCKDRNCTYLHVCKYYFNGNCSYGETCRLSHRMSSDTESSSSSDQDTPRKTKRQPAEKHYQWQIKDKKRWSDIKCDHIIEAQYSLPVTKGIKLYHSIYGVISIDFNKMKICGKDLQVQRKTFPNSPNKDKWYWYYRRKCKWEKFSAKGNTIRSVDIESQYQLNRHKFIQITLNHKSYKICFQEMVQINMVTGTKRRLKRRPKFQRTSCSLSESMGRLNLSGQRQRYRWQFAGKHGNWYDFNTRRGTDTECSVNSKEIEAEYQQNRQGCMTFYVNNSKFQLDFSAMMQTNLFTNATRSIRRVPLSP